MNASNYAHTVKYVKFIKVACKLYENHLVKIYQQNFEFCLIFGYKNSTRKMFSSILKCQNNYFSKPRYHSYSDIKDISNHSDVTQCRYNGFNTPSILVHGSTGNLNDTLIVEKITSCKKAASIGYQSLLNGASPIKAVETTLWWLECDELFNCGYGTLLNEIGLNILFPKLRFLQCNPRFLHICI